MHSYVIFHFSFIYIFTHIKERKEKPKKKILKKEQVMKTGKWNYYSHEGTTSTQN